MSDTLTPSDASAQPTGADRPAADRGTLDVRAKAVEHMVTGAALQVPGCVTRPAGLQRLGTRSLPSATVTFRGSVAYADLHVAVTWPCRADELATTVRDTVRSEASRLSGTDLARVDVTLHVVPLSETRERSTSTRRVQ